MKTSGSGHSITVTPNPKRVRVLFGGTVIADTRRGLILQEGSMGPVHYLPREDAEMALYERTDRVTHCPYKGDASYYSLRSGDRASANAVWSYEAPLPEMTAIAGHLAFYPDKVEIIEEAAP